MSFDDLCGENQILAANAFALAVSKCETAAQTANMARFFSLVSTMLSSIAACKVLEEAEEIEFQNQSTNNNTQIDIDDFIPPFPEDIDR